MIRTIAIITSAIITACFALPAAAYSCIVGANETSHKALNQYEEHDYDSASRTEEQAARTLESCLTASGYYSVASQMRLGELWQYSGQYATLAWVSAGRRGKPQRAKALLLKAKSIYTKLRNIKNIDVTIFDELLLDDRAVEADLAHLSQIGRRTAPTPSAEFRPTGHPDESPFRRSSIASPKEKKR